MLITDRAIFPSMNNTNNKLWIKYQMALKIYLKYKSWPPRSSQDGDQDRGVKVDS